ncbi:MAG: hypothetical protein KGL59_02925 [Acidobacteriota bacterium]|nr:hypothetical protein [Acidobacteriota bacterium]
MNFVKRFSFALAFCLAAAIPSWAQSAKIVYVATGGTQVYAVTTSGGATALISSTAYPNATFTSLTVGPDNTADNANATDASQTYFFLYACDTTGNNIVRFQMSTSSPGSAPTHFETVTTAVSQPVCGRVGSNVEVTTASLSDTTTTSGNLYVSGSTALNGPGVYVITDVSSAPIGGPFNSPTVLYGSGVVGNSFIGGGITQKNSGDLLVVDNHGGDILRAPFDGAIPASATSPFDPSPSTYVSNLSSPVGIARISTGDFFVANQGTDSILKYHPVLNGGAPTQTTCSLSIPNGNVTLSSIAASGDNFLYVGIASTSQSKRVIQVLDGTAAKCGSVGSISLSSLSSASTVAAVAVPPVPVTMSTPTTLTKDSSGNFVNLYNFGSSVFQDTLTNCSPAITETQVPLSFLQNLVNGATLPTFGSWSGGQAIAYKGEGGFGTLYSGASLPADCMQPTVQTAELIGALVDSTQFSNPRIIHCFDGFTGCAVVETTGNWPMGGYIPDDGTTGGSAHGWSQFFLVNGNPPSNPEIGTFCGFGSPLTQTTDPTQAPGPFNSTLSVKFKLAAATSLGTDGICGGNNFITDAVALLSVVQVLNAKGTPTFVPQTVAASGNGANVMDPLFSLNSSNQYEFSLSLSGYKTGTYQLIVTFLSDNPLTGTTNHVPYVITYFTVK